MINVTFSLLLLLTLFDVANARTGGTLDDSMIGLSYGGKEAKEMKRVDYKTVYDQPGVVSYDKNGNPYMLCATGKSTFEQCYVPKNKPTYDKGLACFAVWSGEHAYQGCWSSLHQCQKQKCEAEEQSKTGINFCCCFGYKCNADYSN